MSNDEAFCQRFFAFSKRVPKDVKRFCGICRQHGKMEETRGHICEFKDCECQKCNLVRSRRLVMSQQIRLRRAQDKRFQRTDRPEDADVVPLLTTTQLDNSSNKSPSPPLNGLIIEDDTQQQILDINGKNMCYFCQKCKNHGILVWKKQHKRQCPFTNCNCDFCELIETRRRLDQHLVVARQKNEYNNNKVRLRNRTNNNIQQQQQKEEEGEFNNNIKSNSEDEENILLEEPPKKKKSISIEETNNNNIAGTSIEINNNKDIKLQNEPLEALNEQIWRIQNQKQEYLPNKSSSRNSSISSVDSSSILNDISLLEQQKQKKQLLSSNNNYPLLFNNLISPTTTNIISSQTFSTSLPNFLTNEQQQQQQLLLSQTNQLIENNGNLTFLDQILFNYLNNSILSKNNLLPQSSILSPLHCNNENGNLINDNENNFQKNCLLQIISQLLLQEQQKSKIAETIIGAQNQAFLRNIILNGNNININNNLTTIDSSTNFNFLETQQQQELLQNNNNNNECFQNIEQQQQLQIQSAFNIIQSGFGLL